jgi:branched-chain amino acid transport system substrate-binding protein
MFRKKRIDYIISTLIIFSVFVLFPSCSRGGKTEEASSSLKVYKIGVVLPLTGDFASYGQMSMKGMKLAVKKWTEKNQSFKPELVVEDNLSTTIGAVNGVKKIVEIEKTPIVVGGLASSIALAIVPITEEANVLFMSAFASSPRLADKGKYFFKIMPSDAFQSVLLARWFNELGYKKVGIVHVLSEWGEALKKYFENEFTKQGGKVVFVEGCKEGQKDFKEIVAKLKKASSDLDVIFSPTYPKEGGNFIKQLKEMKIDLPVFGADPWANAEIITIAGESAEGSKFLAPMQYEGPEYQEFQSAFSTEYNTNPDLTASAGYDAVYILLVAIDNLIKANLEVNSDNLRNELIKMDNFIGVTGKTRFDDKGNVISKEFGKRIIKEGKIEKFQ